MGGVELGVSEPPPGGFWGSISGVPRAKVNGMVSGVPGGVPGRVIPRPRQNIWKRKPHWAGLVVVASKRNHSAKGVR